jgi:hypothetical protein
MAGQNAWTRADATVLVSGLHRIVADSATALRTWAERKPARATSLHPVEPVAHRAQRRRADELLAGVDVVMSWIDDNSRPPGRSDGAWHDHAVSIRVRILWYSPRFMVLEPIETWRYEVRTGASVRFETVIEAIPVTRPPSR